MKITVRLQDAEIVYEQKMDETAYPALANEHQRPIVIKSIKELVTEVIRLKSQKPESKNEPTTGKPIQ